MFVRVWKCGRVFVGREERLEMSVVIARAMERGMSSLSGRRKRELAKVRLEGLERKGRLIVRAERMIRVAQIKDGFQRKTEMVFRMMSCHFGPVVVDEFAIAVGKKMSKIR